MHKEKEFYQLSESQKSIWYLEKAYPGTSLNIVAGTMRLKGNIDYKALEQAIKIFVKINDSLRIRIIESEGTALQYFSEYRDFKVDFFDFSKGNGLADLYAWDEAQTRIPINIIDNDLFYIAMIKVSDTDGGFYAKLNHLISDAWTMVLLGQQITELYKSIIACKPIPDEPKPSYKDYLISLAEYENSQRFEKDKQFWNKKFETLPDITVLKPQINHEDSIDAKRKTLLTPVKLSNRIREFCAKTNLSVFTLFMSALAIYIYRVTGTEDIVLGTTILNRVNKKEKDTTGMFVSVAAPVRISIDDSMNFETFANAMQKENTGILRHQKYPYNYLIRDLKKKHKFSGRLFDIVLSYQNSKLSLKDLDEEYTSRWHFSGYQVESLMISINDRDDGGNLIIDYDFLTDVFNVKEIEFIHQHMISLLWHALDNPKKRISRLEMISEKERQLILHDFNDTYADYPREKVIQQIFEEQVKKTPDNIAVIFNNEHMTYSQLNMKANRLARTLRSMGAGSDKIVGIMTYRSFEMVVGIMAILKAGGAYLPIDPDYPDERKKYMLDNAQAEILLAQHDLIDSSLEQINVIDLNDESCYSNESSDLACVNSPRDLAYVIYTSGSTGNPKGVMIEHTGVINRIYWMLKKYSYDESFVIMQKTTYTFDVSVPELLGWSFIGACACLINSGDEKDPEAIISAVERNHVTTIHFVPSMLNVFLDYISSRDCLDRLASLKYVFATGEALTINQVQLFNDLLYQHSKTKLINLYGPTEATIEVSYFECSPMPHLKSIPIGKPIDNLKLYILDKNMNLLPVGIPGELYIGGIGVGRGYINNPELTADKFVPNPFVENDVLYKTGDKARWYPKGDIDFLGRMDFQVKIRGYRIELGEIEARLLLHPNISEAVVTSNTDDNGITFLTAYIVSDGDISTKDIKNHLALSLPDYMIPGIFAFIDSMPLSSNGKIDRKALPSPEFKENHTVSYVPPSNETEKILTAIWSRVLGVDKISILDEYSMLGGDSLKAIKIITEIHKKFGVELSPKAVFQHKTIKQLSDYILSVSDHVNEFTFIPKADEREYYPVSSAQKRQYILNKIDGGISYNIPGGIQIDGKIDRNKVNDIFLKLIDRHESFRTSFEIRDAQPVQIIHKHVDFSIEYIRADEEDFDMLMEAFVKPFDLSCAPLLRVRLVRLSDEKHYLLLDMHHIISDGASIDIIIREFTDLFNDKQLEELDIQYKDYALWHNELLKSDKFKQQETYWLAKFSDEIPVLNMPLDFPRPAVQSFKGDKVHFNIDKKLTLQVKELALKTGSTLFMVLFSAYNIVLSKYSGQEDIVVGVPVEGRRSELRELIGMFVNTLAIRNFPASEKAFLEFLFEVKESLLSAYENQDYPFEELVEKVGVKKDISRNPLFDTSFTFQNYDTADLNLVGLNIASLIFNNKTAKLDIALGAKDNGSDISFTFEYCTDLFNKDTINRLSSHYINTLKDIVSEPAKKLSEINILSEEERHQLLYDFNKTYAEYPRDKTIHQMFEEQVEKTPDNIALVFQGSKMTYRELNERSNRLAHTLRETGIGPNDIVGIIVNRSFEMIISILSVLKAGGAYLPIDPDFPVNRIKYMLENSGSKILILHKEYAERVSFNGCAIIVDDAENYSQESANLTNISTPLDLAYIIYTSGSTGRPKGTIISHKAVLNYCANNSFNIINSVIPEDIKRIVSVTTISFDIFITESLLPLLNGMTVFIADQKEQNQQNKLSSLILNNEVEVLQTTPSKMSLLISDSDNLEYLRALKVIVLGGEAFPISLLYTLRKLTDARIFNVYGPTETTVWSSIAETEADSISIGKPIANTQIYILDKYHKPLPIGITGEIYIGGEGVSYGYHNDLTRTNEVFIPNSFTNSGSMYKTGDLGCWSADGNLIYKGRSDFQIKLRGMRIEIDEIEARLISHKSVKNAVVKYIQRDLSNGFLCAYMITDDTFNEAEVRLFLSQELPDYMIPAYFIKLNEFPLTANGKIDRMSLPEPDIASFDKFEYVAPENKLETELCMIWSSILGIEKIGVMDEYTSIGGNSLNAILIINEIYKKLNAEISPRDIFLYQTIKELSKYIEALPKTGYTPIPLAEKREYYPVSSAQKRQYILKLLDANGTSYNIPCGLLLEGNLNLAQIEYILKEIISRHDSLRTSFELRDGEPVQLIHSNVDFKVEYSEAPVSDYEKALDDFIKPFDLSTAPLLRVKLVRISSDRHLMLIDMHHSISDGASVNILIKEFSALLSGELLPELRIQYKDYSEWHNKLLSSEKMKAQEAYWLDRLSGEIPVLNLPLDFPRPSLRSNKGSRLEFKADSELASGLKKLAAKSGTTLFMLLFSAYNILLSKYANQEDIIVGTPIEGRRHADLRDIIGMFANTLAIRSFPSSDKSFIDFLGEVKDELLNAYDNQDYPFEELVEKTEVKRDLSRNPLFDTLFSYQNKSYSSLTLGELSASTIYNSKTSKFDIALEAFSEEDSIDFVIEYCTDLFSYDTMQRFAEHLINLLKDIVSEPTKKLSAINMLSEEERRQLLYDFNNTDAEYPRDKTIHQIFEEQAEKTPDNIALVFNNNKMTYRELNERANRLARTIRKTGVGSDDIVGIITHRSFEMIVSILGILKAGGAYMPIDPEYPIDRIQYMLENSRTKTLVLHNEYADKVSFTGNKIFVNLEESYSPDCSNLISINNSSDLAYIIYTSGSTGMPKGVMVEHKNLIRLLFNDKQLFDFSASDTWSLFHSYCFDFSVWEIYGALLYGGKLVIVPKDSAIDTKKFMQIIESEKITVLNQTPSAFYNLISIINIYKADISSLKYVIFGGEKLKPQMLKAFNENYPKIKLINMYGITETTVHVTYKELSSTDLEHACSNVGRPIPTLKTYIVDKHMNLQPIGIPGEICVSGKGVSRGYLNNEEQTSEKFILNSQLSDGIIYRSGDLGRYLPTGDIEYLGRIDSQVKIRGFRIELGEIESVLLKHPDIYEVLVTNIEMNGSNKLCAYYKTDNDTINIRQYASAKLPDYMIPSYFIKISSFPLNKNGKIDLKKLPHPSENISVNSSNVLPRNMLERKIADAWAGALQLPKIYIDDNFFELGGDSLNAIKVVSMLDLEINLSDLYVYPTVRQLAEKLSLGGPDYDKLLVNLSCTENPSCNIICIPYGGGSALAFKDMSDSLKKRKTDMNIYSVNLPGHNFGSDEKLLPIETIAEKLVQEVKALQGEIILYSHCVGCALLIAVARLLENENISIKAIFIGGILPPRFIKLYGKYIKPWSLYSDKRLVKYLRKIGLPEAILENTEYIGHLIKVFRHDTQCFSRFLYSNSTSKKNRIKSPLYVIVGDKDITTKNYLKRYNNWNLYFNNVEILVLENAYHYFINSHSESIINKILEIR